MISTKFLKIALLHVVLDRLKINKTISAKAFFLIFWCFYLFLAFVSALLRGENFFSWNRSYRVTKNQKFMLISKMQTYLCDKMPPKKVKTKKQKKWNLTNLENSFFNFNFFGGYFVTKTSLLFWISWKFSIFWYPIWPISRKKNFTSQKSRF